MKRNKREKGHFYWLLARNYIAFTLALVISFSFIAIVATLRISGVLKKEENTTPDLYLDILRSGNYDEFPVEDLLDIDGSIVILDENLKPIYQSIDDISTTYSAKDLLFIPDYNMNSYTHVESYLDANDKERILVTSYIYKGNTAVNQELWIFDEQLNVIYNTRNINITTLTPLEFSYLTRNINNSFEAMKYSFKGNNGENYTMILLKPLINNRTLLKVSHTIRYTLWAFLIIYFIMIICFIYWLHRKVSKPLILLDEAILNFSTGNYDMGINYSGPTEFVQICDNFNRMARRLSESETQKKELENEKKKILANISHDLKTPITVIQGYSKAICDNIIKDDQKDIYLNIIYQKSQSLTELINSFSEYNKLDHPEFKLNLTDVNICEFSREYLAERYDELEVAGFFLEADIPEEVLICNIDFFQLKRVFENIISNFLKYNAKKTTLFFSIAKAEDKVKITLGDNGMGIPIEASEHIFEPFVVGDSSRGTKQGSGLGLAIAEKIVKEHHGKISLITPPAKNLSTEFEILLPLA
ncbi:MAG: HAMP domain-containing sensor histidine kinase [Clostridium sp.]